MTESEVDVVNIAALGTLGIEVDIEQIVADAELPVAYFKPENNTALFRFEESGELIILYTSGKYLLRVGNDFEKMHQLNSRFIDFILDLGITIDEPTLEVKNVVSVGNLHHEIDLNTLTIGLGLEQTEYEPEQFPGLVYRPSGTRCVLLVFASGKVVVTGGRSEEEDNQAFQSLQSKLADLELI
ncbi:TATA-box-binding protein [Halobacterium salinarum]|uniref:TATA-box-binding protein n=1 Tax=Halobacterium salinarum (strain ATCC 33171 / DSM 3754 / JCM 8978 / NBRC 102687 / NCIMB 764 / 91-R6) TaxID=2597657 RepID=A0A4D6GSG8_HALS9|nr:transcription factor [Halobacterium salinarum]QCC44694.1 TATA-binding transcription initiation factor [Halobacterium salinarum]TYO74631.1 TATA binding protein of transcription factor TFIID [Halobacterium salinarum DSM 3754]